jgi:diadenosine tetraphosphatase ApaH/serine/threonine PP2A family protein phosphatase
MPDGAPYAVVSDIHANLPAWTAVLKDIESRGIGRILCLGDVVGYGPDPCECVTLVRTRCEFTLKGNHDVAVLFEPLGFNQAARQAAIWTKRQLEPGWFASAEKRRNWEFLKSAAERQVEGEVLYVHGSPRDPVMEYIEENDLADMGFGPGEKIQEIFRRVERLCFVGHTHRPGVFTQDYRFLKPADLNQVWDRTVEKAVVNVGSVGQPRDGDPRACYAVVESSKVCFCRVAYDVQGTADRIRAIPALGRLLGDRLLEGR